MMLSNPKNSALALLTITCGSVISVPAVSRPARDPIMARRCAEDAIYRDKVAQQRNAWANKCGFLSETKRDDFDSHQYYMTFVEGDAPNDVAAPCGPYMRWHPLGPCPLGCFTADEPLLFAGRYVALAEAAMRGETAVTGLSRRATLASLVLADHAVGRYTVGPTTRPLIRIGDTSGHTLTVTQDHPVIACSGEVVAARTLAVGDEVLALDGCRTLAAIDSWLPLSGEDEIEVWNVEPQSEDPVENTTVASGYITGSLRFQNEWAVDDARLALRRRLVAESQSP